MEYEGSGSSYGMYAPSRIAAERSSSDEAALSLDVEERALTWLEKQLRAPLQRHLRFSGKEGTIAVDGFCESSTRGEDLVVEVKSILVGEHSERYLHSAVSYAFSLAQRYKDITKRSCELCLLIVVRNREDVSSRVWEEAEKRIKEAEIYARLALVELEELGISLPAPTQDEPESN